MFNSDNINSYQHQQQRNIRSLIFGRLAVIIFLLLTGWAWYGGPISEIFVDLPHGPLSVLVISLTLTAVYFVLLYTNKFLGIQVKIQLIIDAILITWLVRLTGDFASPYVTLYIVLIGVSSIFLNPIQTLGTAFICVFLFTALAVLTIFGVVEQTGVTQPVAKIIQYASFNVVAFLVVGLLAARLSDRRFSGEKLKETAKSLADLRAFHERIIESIRSGLITTDLDGNIFTVNAAAAEITGYSSGSLVGSSSYAIFGDLKEPIQLTVAAEERGDNQPRFETDLITPDGFAVRIGYGLAQLYSEEKETTGFIITFQDLTEIRSMEESVRRKDRLAAVGRIAAGLAHEIRNPLGAMRGAIQVLESTTPPDSMQADLMGIILRESDRLNNIIINFLNYARPKAGNFSETDVCQAIRETIKLLGHSPEVKEFHKLECELPDHPVILSADITQLKQIFWNLARNSLNAMPSGGTLKVKIELIPINRVRILFEDTGVGMSPDQVEQLFEPFSNSTTGGTGLGLSIVYQIIKDHNGTINVRSSQGEGTVIAVELPLELNVQTAADESIDISQTPSPLTDFLKVKNDN